MDGNMVTCVKFSLPGIRVGFPSIYCPDFVLTVGLIIIPTENATDLICIQSLFIFCLNSLQSPIKYFHNHSLEIFPFSFFYNMAMWISICIADLNNPLSKKNCCDSQKIMLLFTYLSYILQHTPTIHPYMWIFYSHKCYACFEDNDNC